MGGTVASVSDASFTVNGARRDTVTVEVTDDTTITKVGDDGQEEAIELADLEAGDTVMVRGEPSDDAIAATDVRVGELPGGPGMGRSGNGDCGPGMGEGARAASSRRRRLRQQQPEDGYGTSNQTTSAPHAARSDRPVDAPTGGGPSRPSPSARATSSPASARGSTPARAPRRGAGPSRPRGA